MISSVFGQRLVLRFPHQLCLVLAGTNQVASAAPNFSLPMSSNICSGKECFINEGDLTNVQYKPNWNCHYESPPI
jgi:hypothetical protein